MLFFFFLKKKKKNAIKKINNVLNGDGTNRTIFDYS